MRWDRKSKHNIRKEHYTGQLSQNSHQGSVHLSRVPQQMFRVKPGLGTSYVRERLDWDPRGVWGGSVGVDSRAGRGEAGLYFWGYRPGNRPGGRQRDLLGAPPLKLSPWSYRETIRSTHSQPGTDIPLGVAWGTSGAVCTSDWELGRWLLCKHVMYTQYSTHALHV